MFRAISEENIERIRQILEGVESINYAFIFGSAIEKLLPESDIDILIGGEMDFYKKMHLTATLTSLFKRNVDLVLAGEARCELVIKAMSKGRLVFVKNRESLKQDYLRNWREFDDNTGLRRMKVERIKREYAYGR